MSDAENKKYDEFLSKYHKYRSKSDGLKRLIRQTLAILEILGIPFDPDANYVISLNVFSSGTSSFLEALLFIIASRSFTYIWW